MGKHPIDVLLEDFQRMKRLSDQAYRKLLYAYEKKNKNLFDLFYYIFKNANRLMYLIKEKIDVLTESAKMN